MTQIVSAIWLMTTSTPATAGSSQPDNVGHLVDDYQHDMVAVNQNRPSGLRLPSRAGSHQPNDVGYLVL